MKKIFLILTVLLVTSFAYSSDFDFEAKGTFINEYLKEYESVLKENGLKDFEIELGNNKGKINFGFGALSISVKLEFNIVTVTRNKFVMYITKFKVLGFLPWSRKMAAEKIVEAIRSMPALKGCIQAQVFEDDNAPSDKELGVKFIFIKAPVRAVSDLNINSLRIVDDKIKLSADLVLNL